MGEAIYAAFFGAGFFMAIVGDWCVRLALPLAELQVQKLKNCDLQIQISGLQRIIRRLESELEARDA